MSKVVVIGAGAAGMVAAIKISNSHDVILLESNDKCGKKILLTGNGRCNYWNSDINIDKYNTDNNENLNIIINRHNQEKVLLFLEKIGIYPKIKNGYYYPYSNQASSVRTLLLNNLIKRKVQIIYNFKVEDVIKNNNKFIVKSNDNEIICDKVILANGSCAMPKTGSDGSSYELAKKLGHTINQVTPSLVPLEGKGSFFKEWDGVRCDSRVSLFIDNEKIKEEFGEIQLTSYGISGICTFNISGIATKSLKLGKKVAVKINFLPTIEVDFYNWMASRNNNIPNHTIEELLESVIPYKLMLVLLKNANIDRNSYWNNLSENDKKLLSTTIENFSIEIIGHHSFDKAQVATGGVSLNEINPLTMESRIIPGLYLVGELLDADGICGGFNLSFAFISGYIAGDALND